MKHVAALAALLLPLAATASPACPPLLDHTLKDIEGKPQSLCAYAGEVVMVVNTASRCGYTGQYKGLQALYEKYRAQGFVVLGFPANDFANQEPGSNAQIRDFCETNYSVDFPLFSKVGVLASNANPLHEALARATGERPRWNFHKYLIDRSGAKAISFPSAVEPQSKDVVRAIETMLKAPAPAQKGS